jgi:hypothetical protein
VNGDGSEAATAPSAGPCSDNNTMRWLGLGGLGLALMSGLSFPFTGLDIPEESAQAAAEHFSAHRTEIIIASIGGVFCNALAVVVFAGWAYLLRTPAWARALGIIGLTAMVLQLAVVSAAFAVLGGLAYTMPGTNAISTGSELAWTVINLGGGPATVVAVIAFTLALRRTGLSRSSWMWPLAVATTIAHTVVSMAFASDGFMAPEGGVAIVVPLFYFAWIGGISVELLARSRADESVFAGASSRGPREKTGGRVLRG